MLPLPDLAGNAVLVWYSMLSHNLWWMVEGINLLQYRGTPKLGVINHPTWSSDMPPVQVQVGTDVVGSDV